MKNKINILLVTSVLTIIVFFISTNMQKKLINYEPKVKCLVTTMDIYQNQKLEEEMFEIKEIPFSLVSNISIVTDFSEIENLYSKTDVYKGQIAFKKLFDSQEKLSIFEAENGKEKISVKIENPENGVSYAIKKNSLINLYATIKNSYAENFLIENDRLQIGDEYDGYTVIKILDSTKVLGVFNIDGIEIENSQDGIIDSIMIAVDSNVAKQISLLRDIGIFNVTGVNSQSVKEEANNENIDVSGEVWENEWKFIL